MRENRTRDLLERATGGREPNVDRLLDKVPWMMREAARRRDANRGRTTLAVSIPLARRVIPGLAAATAVLALIGTAFWFGGASSPTTTERSNDIGDLIVSGNGLTDRLLVERILEPEERP